jgi:hypothetical protein
LVEKKQLNLLLLPKITVPKCYSLAIPLEGLEGDEMEVWRKTRKYRTLCIDPALATITLMNEGEKKD